jgi:DNA-binding transcriptional LysR family regulator
VRALRVNHATVSRGVARLEALLERVLFERRTEGCVLSVDGKAVLDGVSAMDKRQMSSSRS